MRTHAISIIFLGLMTFTFIAGAGDLRTYSSFVSEDGKYELSKRDKTWVLSSCDNDEGLYTVSGYYGMRSAHILDEGRSIIALADPAIESGMDVQPVLEFFRKGISISKYYLHDLLTLNLPRNRLSTHYYKWFIGEAHLSEMTLRITTFELVSYSFDIRTGNILLRETDPRLSSDAIFAWGPIIKNKECQYTLHVFHPIIPTDPIPNSIPFVVLKSLIPTTISTSLPYSEVDSIKSGEWYCAIIHNGVLVAYESNLVNICEEVNTLFNPDHN